jgi:hypothetical protein
MIALPKVLPAPDKIPENLNKSAKWLAGEGAGSWFSIEETERKNTFEICRFSPIGKLECKGVFISTNKFYLQKDYEITYPSHCAVVTVIQENQTITFRPFESEYLEDSLS